MQDDRSNARKDGARWRWARWLAALVLALVIVLPLVLWRREIAGVFADPERVLDAVRGAGPWGPLMLVALTVAQVIAAPIPGQALNFVAGYLYGFWPGALYSWVGNVVGSTLAMALARYAGRPLVVRLIDPARVEQFDRLASGKGLPFFFLVFLVPLLPDDLACFLAGLTALPLPALILTAAAGRIPGLVAAVWAGSRAEAFGAPEWLLMGALSVAGLLIAWRWGARIQGWLFGELTKRDGSRRF